MISRNNLPPPKRRPEDVFPKLRCCFLFIALVLAFSAVTTSAWARYYGPALGRFISPDSVIPDAYNPQALASYSYVGNNPLRYTDPSGHGPYDIALCRAYCELEKALTNGYIPGLNIDYLYWNLNAVRIVRILTYLNKSCSSMTSRYATAFKEDIPFPINHETDLNGIIKGFNRLDGEIIVNNNLKEMRSSGISKLSDNPSLMANFLTIRPNIPNGATTTTTTATPTLTYADQLEFTALLHQDLGAMNNQQIPVQYIAPDPTALLAEFALQIAIFFATNQLMHGGGCR